jgi:hypothetical protein
MLKYFFLLIAVGIICINIWYYVGYYKKINIREKDVPERIVVSLTTSPKRISKIQPVIECIEKQTIKPKYICLNLPRVYKRDTLRPTTCYFLKERKDACPLNVGSYRVYGRVRS